MQTRPNSPETLPTILDGACAHPSPQLLTGLTLAPRADAFNDVLPPPLPQMRDGGDLRFYVVTSNWHLRLFRVLHLHPITSATSLTLRCVSHPVSAPHPCAPASMSIPTPLARWVNSPASSLQRRPHAMCPHLCRYTAHLKHEQGAPFFSLYILYLYYYLLR